MKELANYHLFSNFNAEISNYSINKSALTISNIYNLTTENNVIEPINNFSNFFEKQFTKSEYNLLQTNCGEQIKPLIYSTVYSYYDSQSHVTKNRIFAIDNNYNLLELNTETLTLSRLDFKFSNFPKVLNINGRLYFYNYDDLFLMIHQNNYPLVITTPPNLTSIINYHDTTLFTVLENKFSVFISPLVDVVNIELDYSNYAEIKLDEECGEVKNIIVYKNNIYIIQQYVISKLTINNDKYIISSFCSIKSEIYADTISLIDDYIVFFTTSGLYLFDGNDIKQIFKSITKNITGNLFKAIAFNNKYYFMTNYYINNISESVLLQFDIENNYCTIFKIGKLLDVYIIQNLQNYKLNAVVENNDKTYSILTFDNNLICQNKKYIKFNKLTFDESPIKVLSEIKLQSIGKYKINIHTEFQSVYYEVYGNAYIKNIGLKGQTFEIEIESDHSFMIESILLKTTSYSEG